jgi:hypothetical protein
MKRGNRRVGGENGRGEGERERGCSLVVLQLGIEEKIFPMATRRGT